MLFAIQLDGSLRGIPCRWMVFLRSGLTTESLKSMGNMPVDKERLMILVIVGMRRVVQSLIKRG